ncbi:Choline-sulfatase [Candidatus Rhodobacter oscarellae]|uniref:Choline-sulfatase n=1 Tax=Candidatus Rhodobacter oscarellae TaxID=1675527 RepID=A0A0J9E0H1_9RHOB|nr:sulfatase-like hydrolase/transferase [Candidatus Rhodobacter lobularis]KMW56215.1 Choline-sulfatase [Candidatus Rhodobacter lobularis]
MSDQPNILYIITDQHRADWLGCAGHPVVKTPHIDSLAARGTRFTQFHVTTPICMPNRGAIFTGRYPSVNGLRHNGLPLPRDAHTFVDLLADAGYRTAQIGKSHLQPFNPNPLPAPGGAHPSFPEATSAPGVGTYGLEQGSNFEGLEPTEFPEGYYGFQHVRLVTSHSDKCGGHYLQWLRGQTDDWQALRDWDNQLPHDYTCPQAVRTPLPEALYPTSYIKEEAKAYLADQKDSEDPFFAFVSFPDPHHPFTPPGKYWDMYDPEDFSVDLPYEAHQNPPEQLVKWKELMEAGVVPATLQQAFLASDGDIKQAMALTAGMISMIDDAIGEILAALEASGKADNTIIIFNSDHGDYMGAFNLLLKGPFGHDSVNRVPFIWVDPKGRAVETADGLAASVDIAPTLLERVGIAPYFGMQGKSFLGQLSGAPAARDYALIEHEENKPYPGLPERPNMRHLVTDSHRMTVYKGLTRGELYDRRSDPNETNNLWDKPEAAQAKAQMMFALGQAMLEAIEPGPRPHRVA